LRKKDVRIVPEMISQTSEETVMKRSSHGRIVVAHRRPTQNSVPAKMPAKKG
jgi:hypothetical protein